MDNRPDRWVVKVLSVGCFDDQFRRAVLAGPLASLDFVYSVEAESEVSLLPPSLRGLPRLTRMPSRSSASAP